MIIPVIIPLFPVVSGRALSTAVSVWFPVCKGEEVWVAMDLNLTLIKGGPALAKSVTGQAFCLDRFEPRGRVSM